MPTTTQRLAPLTRLWLATAGLFGSSGMVIAALLAHRAAGVAPAGLALAHTALEIQIWHALALLGIAALCERRHSRVLSLAGAGFVLGTLAFSGAVYAAALGAPPGWPIAPVGGTLLILSWAALVAAAAAG